MKKWGKNDVPEFNTVLGMSLIFLCNMASLIVLIDILSGYQGFLLGLKKLEVGTVIISIALFHYFLFMHKGKYKQIVEEFDGEDPNNRRRKGWLVFAYSIGSVIFFILILFLGAYLKNNGM